MTQESSQPRAGMPDHPTRAGETPEEAHDRRLGALIGIPGVSQTTFQAVRETLPLGLGISTTGYQLVKVAELNEPTRILLFVEEGTGSTRRALVLGDKTTRAILRAATRLQDARSPDARARASRRVKLERKRRRDHKADRHAKRPIWACEDCRKVVARAYWKAAQG